MKRTQLKRGTKQMKRGKLNKVSKQPINKLQKELYEVSHTYIRKRDSISDDKIGGYCFDCGKYEEGQQFQAGHFIPDASGGAILRYHPHNMHGQRGGCNMKHQQETVKINYTLKMIEKYGRKYVDKLKALKWKTIRADEIFYNKMIELYKAGNEKKIISYLNSL